MLSLFLTDNVSNLKFLIFVASLIYPRYKGFCYIIYMLRLYLGIESQKKDYTLRIVSAKYLNSLLKSRCCDVNNSVVIIVNEGDNHPKRGQLAVLCVKSKDKGLVKRKVIVFYVTDNCCGTESLLCPNTLLHNFKCPSGFNTCNVRFVSSQRSEFVDELEVSLINSPHDWGQLVIDTVLKSYFKRPKLVYCGDTIEVNLSLYGPELFYSSTRIKNIDENIYFKCNRILDKGNVVGGRGCFCLAGETTLKQAANVQSFIPPQFPDLYSEIYDWGNANSKSVCPGGLLDYFDQMSKAIVPFISPHSRKTASGNFNFRPVFLVEGRKGCGKSVLVHSLAAHFGLHLHTVNNFEVSANVYAQNETKLRNVLFGAKMSAPVLLELRNFENFGKNNEGEFDDRLIQNFATELSATFFTDNSPFPVFLFCTLNEKNTIPLGLKRLFLKVFEIRAPNEIEREKMLNWFVADYGITLENDFNLVHIASRTHGFLFEDLRALVYYARNNFLDSANRGSGPGSEHFLKALDFMQSNYNESLGAPKVPKVHWSDVGGLSDVKDEIIKTIKFPMKHAKLLATSGLRRSGILLYGPPGTGKTLMAKAVATECGLCFLSVKGPELLNMYVGQSEQNVREVFERAREASPCIIFFDELDSLAPNRGASGDSGGVMDRVVSQLLAEMDGLNESGTIFVIGATNRPDLIDPALLRPGRFDKLLYIGPCVDRESKLSVLKALTRKFNLSCPDILEELADLCPQNFSGADYYGVCSSAWMSAVRKLIEAFESQEGSLGECSASSEDVVVTLEDFTGAIKGIKPSISKEDMEYFNKLKTEL